MSREIDKESPSYEDMVSMKDVKKIEKELLKEMYELEIRIPPTRPGWFPDDELQALDDARRPKSINRILEFNECLEWMDRISRKIGEAFTVDTDHKKLKIASWKTPGGNHFAMFCDGGGVNATGHDEVAIIRKPANW